jgi:transcriptional regulator with XRE-family HTH domain
MGLLQKEVAAQLGLDDCTVANWEKDRTYPAVRFLPRLIRYLGYDPFPKPHSLGERLRAMRQCLGLSRKLLAGKIGIDDGTLAQYENGTWKPGARNEAILERFLARGEE